MANELEHVRQETIAGIGPDVACARRVFSLSVVVDRAGKCRDWIGGVVVEVLIWFRSNRGGGDGDCSSCVGKY